MATVTKTWSFPTDAQGLVQDVAGAAVTFSWVSADQAVQFAATTRNLNNSSQTASTATSGVTWESWGVPAGATVTNVQITGWSLRLAANAGAKASSFYIYLQAPGGFSITPAQTFPINNAVLPATPTSTTYTPQAAGSVLAVQAAYQASNQEVYLRLQVYINTGTSPNVQYRFDDIVLEITYTPAAGGGGAAAAAYPAALLMAM